jgi:S1-C subfamily serine protease
MKRAQLAVPVVAALLGAAASAAVIAASDDGAGALTRQQGLVDLGQGEALTSTEIYERAAPGVVYVRARTVQPGAGAFQAETGSELANSTGSGFVLDEDGRVLTSAHVVSGVTAVQVSFADGRSAAAEVVAKDEGTDLAVLEVPPDGLELRPLKLGDSSGVMPGDQVVAMGNPTGFQATAGTGRVSATGRSVEAPGGYLIEGVLQTDAVIEPASSGGPLLGPDGRVVGIVSRIGSAPPFAIPSNLARDVLADLEEAHKVIRPYLGLHGTTVEGGVLVDRIDADSPADAAGLHVDDVIEAVDGQPVGASVDLLAEVEEREPGDTLELRVLRDGARGDVSVRLVERPATLPLGRR